MSTTNPPTITVLRDLDGEPDDVTIHGVSTIRLERMGTSWWGRIILEDGREAELWIGASASLPKYLPPWLPRSRRAQLLKWVLGRIRTRLTLEVP